MSDNKTKDLKEKLWFEVNYILKRNEIDSYINRCITNDTKKLPIIFLIGLPRSGTTLLHQAIVKTFDIGYINNLIANFWEAPYVGALLSERLLKYNTGENKIGFESSLGSTKEPDGPHSFGYFWARWVPDGENFDKSEIIINNTENLRKEISLLKSVIQKPIIFKNAAIISYLISQLKDIFPESFFIYLKRESLYVMQSFLTSRLKYHNNKDKWIFIKPKEYAILKNLTRYDQIAGQIYYIKKEIDRQFSMIPHCRKFEVNYEIFCKDPTTTLIEIKDFVKKNGFNLRQTGSTPKSFTNRNYVQIGNYDFNKIKEANKRFFG